MSRIGRVPVPVPTGVDVDINGAVVTVKGPKGTLTHTIPAPIEVARDEAGALVVTRPDDERASRSLHGLTRTLLANLVIGVTEGYVKKLEIVGTGYRVTAKGVGPRVRARLQPPRHGRPAGGHHVRRRGANTLLRAGHRQAGGRRGRREHPQDPQARAVQGQGRAVRRRERSPQGRKGR